MPFTRSDKRTLAGGGLLIFASIFPLVIFGQLLAALIPPGRPVNTRVLVALAIAAVILTVAAATLHAWSVLWQVPLQTFAIAAFAVGLRYLIEVLFRDWHKLLTLSAALCAGYVVVGLGAALFMKRLQVTFLGHRKRRLTIVGGGRAAR